LAVLLATTVGFAVRVGGLNAVLLATVVAPPAPISGRLAAAGAFVVAVSATYAVALLHERDTRS